MTTDRRHLVTAATLTALALVVIVMAWWGVHAATKPFPGSPAAAAPSCTAAETTRTTYVTRKDVTVSVYNAGARQGFATLTLHRLEALGFHPGEVANAPSGTNVARARVLTTKTHDAAAELVARTLGKNVRIEVTGETYGPGIDVLVGKSMKHLNAGAPRRVRLAHPITHCVPVN